MAYPSVLTRGTRGVGTFLFPGDDSTKLFKETLLQFIYGLQLTNLPVLASTSIGVCLGNARHSKTQTVLFMLQSLIAPLLTNFPSDSNSFASASVLRGRP